MIAIIFSLTDNIRSKCWKMQFICVAFKSCFVLYVSEYKTGHICCSSLCVLLTTSSGFNDIEMNLIMSNCVKMFYVFKMFKKLCSMMFLTISVEICQNICEKNTNVVGSYIMCRWSVWCLILLLSVQCKCYIRHYRWPFNVQCQAIKGFVKIVYFI